jgi:hypothetical protein
LRKSWLRIPKLRSPGAGKGKASVNSELATTREKASSNTYVLAFFVTAGLRASDTVLLSCTNKE